MNQTVILNLSGLGGMECAATSCVSRSSELLSPIVLYPWVEQTQSASSSEMWNTPESLNPELCFPGSPLAFPVITLFCSCSYLP